MTWIELRGEMKITDRIIRWFVIRKLKQIAKEGKMKKFLDFLKGKKTYIVALVVGAGAAATALGYTVPEWVYGILGALGLTTLRAGVKKKGE